jgi:hypothetical protein
MRSCRGKLGWILLAALGILLVVAVASLVTYLVLRQQPSSASSWSDPVGAIVPGEIVPGLALYPLAGAAELETVDAAMATGDLETAYALLMFGSDMTDAQRIGHLILLGDQFSAAEKPDRAGLSYQQVYDLAVLSPRLNDPARADALMAGGKGWAGLGEKTKALEAYDQVYLIAAQSPYLQMANRRDLLTELETAYGELGEKDRAEGARTRIVELDQQAPSSSPVTSAELPNLPNEEAGVSSPEVGVLEEARRQAAYALIEGLAGGGEPPADLVNGLATALKAEDAAKLDLYSRELGGTTQSGKRIGIEQQWIRWLMLKYQVASKGLGLSLVPEWEAQLPAIQSDLSKANEGLFFDYEDLVAALPEASLMQPGSYEVRRQAIEDGRLGRYPNYPAQQLADKLQEAVRGLIDAGGTDALYVDVRPDDSGLYFFLSPASDYGLSSQSP